MGDFGNTVGEALGYPGIIKQFKFDYCPILILSELTRAEADSYPLGGDSSEAL